MHKIISAIMLCNLYAALFGVELIDDVFYRDKAQSEFIEAKNDPNKLILVAGTFMDARDYAKAEDIYLDLIKKYKINDPLIYSNLSVFQGKQGKYKQAIESADFVLGKEPSNMHANAVKASWLYESGEKESGLKLFESIPTPSVDSELFPFYCGCGACFYASTGNIEKVKYFINRLIEYKDVEGLNFVKRDVVFDKYRNDEWFISLIGKTLK